MQCLGLKACMPSRLHCGSLLPSHFMSRMCPAANGFHIVAFSLGKHLTSALLSDIVLAVCTFRLPDQTGLFI